VEYSCLYVYDGTCFKSTYNLQLCRCICSRLRWQALELMHFCTACVVIFKLQNSEKHIQYYTIYTTCNEQQVKLNEQNKPLHGVVALCAQLQASLHSSPVLPINCPIPYQATSPPTPCPHSVPRPIASPVWITFISSKRRHQLCGNTSWSGTLPWWCHLLHIYMVVILPSCISLLSGDGNLTTFYWILLGFTPGIHFSEPITGCFVLGLVNMSLHSPDTLTPSVADLTRE
jgi:hypothetical protein